MSRPLATHSIYFQVLGDLGFVGLLIYGAMGIHVFYLRRQIEGLEKKRFGAPAWATELANLIAMAMMFFVVGGGLLSLAYYEMPFYLAMLMTVVRRVADQEGADEVTNRLPVRKSVEQPQ